jgi:hypothetical protein
MVLTSKSRGNGMIRAEAAAVDFRIGSTLVGSV